MGYLAHGPPFFAWVVDETKLEIENLENQTPQFRACGLAVLH